MFEIDWIEINRKLCLNMVETVNMTKTLNMIKLCLNMIETMFEYA